MKKVEETSANNFTSYWSEAQSSLVGEARIQLPASMQDPGAAIDVGVRAEFVNLDSEGSDATIRLVQPVGPFTYVTVGWEGGSATARLNGVSHLKPREQIKVNIDPEGLLFFDKTSVKRLELS